MTDRICSIDGCERPFYGRTWCNKHYTAWYKYGDPLTNKTKMPAVPRVCSVDGCDHEETVKRLQLCGTHYSRWRATGDPTGIKRKRNVCCIDGCDLLCVGRGWCSKHWTRWQRYGDPLARLPGELLDGKLICPGCHLDLPLADYGVSRTRTNGVSSCCRSCGRMRTNSRRAAKPRVVMPDSAKTSTSCAGCGVIFLANKRRRKYCSPECSKAYRNRDNWVHLNTRRAREREAFVEAFDRREIFERDGWICGICKLAIDQTLKFPDPGSASLDHIIPIVHGGKHERANAQASHLHCNVVKSDHVA